MSRFTIFFLLLCISISCDINNSKSDALDQVRSAQKKWNAVNPQDYTYQYQSLCFCAFTDEVRIVVRADSVIDVQNITTNETIMVAVAGTDIEAPIHEFYPSSFFTINQFFDRLEVQIPVADDSEVSFDRSTGMPIEISFDYIVEAIDDEITYLFSNLVIN